LWIKRRVCR